MDFISLSGTYENAQLARQSISLAEISLIFLDIEMPGLSGIDLIRSLKNPPLIIITTAYPKYAHIGYDLDVIDYLVKPIAFPRFLKAVNKAKEVLQSRNIALSKESQPADHFFVKENGRFIKILMDDVLYIEALQNYVAIHLHNKKVVSYITLSLPEKQLQASRFMRIHKSYMVYRWIKSIPLKVIW